MDLIEDYEILSLRTHIVGITILIIVGITILIMVIENTYSWHNYLDYGH